MVGRGQVVEDGWRAGGGGRMVEGGKRIARTHSNELELFAAMRPVI